MSAALELAPEFCPDPRPARPVPSRRPERVGGPPAGSAPVVTLHRPGGSALPLRLTRRGVAVLACAVAVVAAALVALAWASAPAPAPAHRAPAVVTVHSGDTLWSLALRVAPDRDPRAEVDRLRQINHLDGAGLQPGQVLRVR